MEFVKAIETIEKGLSLKDKEADIYKISESREPPWENKRSGESTRPDDHGGPDGPDGPDETNIISQQENFSEKKPLTPLTDHDRKVIKDETGWSDEIVNAIQYREEYQVYKDANLVEAEINGRKCLVRPDLDLDHVDPKTGKTNRELMAMGRAPIDPKTGEKVTLHHIGQKFDAPLAELLDTTEHSNNTGILHTSREPSWRNDPGKKDIFNDQQRPDHWKARANQDTEGN